MLAPWKKSYDQPRQHIKKQRHHFVNKILGWVTQKLESRFLGENINSLGYADDTTLEAESEEELKGLLMKVKKLA